MIVYEKRKNDYDEDIEYPIADLKDDHIFLMLEDKPIEKYNIMTKEDKQILKEIKHFLVDNGKNADQFTGKEIHAKSGDGAITVTLRFTGTCTRDGVSMSINKIQYWEDYFSSVVV